MHLNLNNPVAAAGLAAAALDVETEAAFIVSLRLRVGGGSEQIPNQVKDAGIGSRIGTGSPADGRLIDRNNLIQLFNPLDFLVLSRYGSCPVQFLCQSLIENLVDQRALSRTGHTGYAGHHSKRKPDRDVFQIILRRPLHRQPSAGRSAYLRYRNLHPAAEISPGNGLRAIHNLLSGSHGYHFSTMFSRSGSDIHNTVRGPHGILIVLHHQNAVSQIPQV